MEQQILGKLYNPITSNTLKEVKKIIDIRLAVAQSNALEADEMRELLNKKSVLESQDDPDNRLQLERVNENLSKRMVVVQTLFEYKYLLEKVGISKERVIHVLSHENAHANKAESLGENFGGYALLVWRNNNNFEYLPFALTAVNTKIGNRKEQIEKEIAITNAPKEYGNTLSPADEERISALRKLLNKLI